MRLFIPFLALCVLALSPAQAQEQPWCGLFPHTHDKASMDNRLSANLDLVANGVLPRELSYVPVKFHLVAKTDGSGRISEQRVLDQLCELNEDFEPYNIQFFLADGTFNYIDNDAMYDNHDAVTTSVMIPNRDTRALNVWIVNMVGVADGVLAYYNPGRDWVVVGRSYVQANNSTLSHEFGHFFSLDHTFYGWESEPYNTENVPAPTYSPDDILTERADRSNCTVAGDRICDTREDYNNGLGWSNCNFTRNVLDPGGNAINPDERNFMGYFLNCPDEEYFFSTQQSNIMQTDLMSFSRNFLRADPVPTLAEVESAVTPTAPTHLSTGLPYDVVELSWEAVPGATHYLVEVSRLPTYAIDPIREIVAGTSLAITDLLQNTEYYWRVRPFNAHKSCQSSTSNQRFRTGNLTAVKEPAQVRSFQVSPNPAQAGQSLRIELNVSRQLDAMATLYRMDGSTAMPAQEMTFQPSQQQYAFPLVNLPAGFYVLSIQSADGLLQSKICITQ